MAGINYDETKDINFPEPCADGKPHRSSFSKSGGKRATQQLEIVHNDICARIEANSPNGTEYLYLIH